VYSWETHRSITCHGATITAIILAISQTLNIPSKFEWMSSQSAKCQFVHYQPVVKYPQKIMQYRQKMTTDNEQYRPRHPSTSMPQYSCSQVAHWAPGTTCAPQSSQWGPVVPGRQLRQTPVMWSQCGGSLCARPPQSQVEHCSTTAPAELVR